MMHFQTWKKLIFTNITLFQLLFSLNVVCIVFSWYYDQNMWQWHILHIFFASMNQQFNGNLSYFLTEVSFVTSEEKQLSGFQKLIIFENSLIILWPYYQVKCRLKDKIISELFTIKNFHNRIVTFLPGQSLAWIKHSKYHSNNNSILPPKTLKTPKLYTKYINSR